uniref:Uncharacterized protein n=1 Tax=Astyanax mexicanus TaxID=7994 RepID=W5KTJ9_ASTMX
MTEHTLEKISTFLFIIIWSFYGTLLHIYSRLKSKQLFQSDWDIASFAIFFIFIGMVLLLVVLVIIRCCCCCCCDEKIIKASFTYNYSMSHC